MTGVGHFLDRKVFKPALRGSGVRHVLGKRGSNGIRKAFRFVANPHRTLERSHNTKGFFRPAAKVLHNFDLPQAWRKVKGWISHAANHQASVGTSSNSAQAVQTSPRYTLDYRYRRLSDLS